MYEKLQWQYTNTVCYMFTAMHTLQVVHSTLSFERLRIDALSEQQEKDNFNLTWSQKNCMRYQL